MLNCSHESHIMKSTLFTLINMSHQYIVKKMSHQYLSNSFSKMIYLNQNQPLISVSKTFYMFCTLWSKINRLATKSLLMFSQLSDVINQTYKYQNYVNT